MRIGWDRMEPEAQCTSPDGHSEERVFVFGSEIPEGVYCGNCGLWYSVITFGIDDESGPAASPSK